MFTVAAVAVVRVCQLPGMVVRAEVGMALRMGSMVKTELTF